jgi:hypothetical protein
LALPWPTSGRASRSWHRIDRGGDGMRSELVRRDDQLPESRPEPPPTAGLPDDRAPPVALGEPTIAGGGPAHSAVVESRWIPLVPGAHSFPSGVSTRSGAFLMAATRVEPGLSSAPRAGELDFDLRSALISCLEAIAPALEPGWSTCHEHLACRAVQEASGVLWGTGAPAASASSPPTGPPSPPLGPRPVADPANLPTPDDESAPRPGNPLVMSPPAPSGARP